MSVRDVDDSTRGGTDKILASRYVLATFLMFLYLNYLFTIGIPLQIKIVSKKNWRLTSNPIAVANDIINTTPWTQSGLSMQSLLLSVCIFWACTHIGATFLHVVTGPKFPRVGNAARGSVTRFFLS